MTKRIKITQIRSTIRRPEKHNRIMRALGLRKMHMVVEHNADPNILGMINKISHLVKVEEV